MRNLYDEGKIRVITDGKTLTKQLRSCFILLLTLTVSTFATAQLVITQNTNAQSLAQSLAGPGVTVSNFSLTAANAGSAGTFVNDATNLGIDAGVILSTGNTANIAKPASAFASNAYMGYGDPQLQSLTGGYVYDKTVLEFDIVPQGNVLMFNYVFASEEYPEWVCTQFNDVFGFFISGPKPGGGNYSGKNIALVPNTNLPVAINTINPGTSGIYGIPTNCQSLSYSAYYRDNLTPTVNPNIVYDGMTTVLTAVASVIPCRTYHLKLAVADVNDRIYDSGVFIEANSITSMPVTITSSSQLAGQGYDGAFEGCVGGTFTFSLPESKPYDIQVAINIGGTATNGVDYPTIPPVITIPAGQLSTDLHILPTKDNLVEGDETIIISTSNPCTGAVLSSAQMIIKDDLPATVMADKETICAGQTAQLEAHGGLTYSWSPASSLSSDTIANPIASPTATTTYSVNMDWGSCVKTLTKTINVTGAPIQLTAAITDVPCNNTQAGAIQLTAQGGTAPYQFSWSNGGALSSIQQLNAGVFQVTVTDASGCAKTDSFTVASSGAAALQFASADVSCHGSNDGSISVSLSGGTAPFNFVWSDGVQTQNRQNLAAGNYTLTLTDANGCTTVKSAAVAEPAAMNVQLNVSAASCAAATGSAAVNVTNGHAPYHYQWSHDPTNHGSAAAQLAPGAVTVTVTDAEGCTTTRSASVPVAANLADADFHYAGSFCAGSAMVQFTADYPLNGTTHFWSFDNAAHSSAINPSYLFADAGNYTVSHIVSSGFCADTVTKQITVYATPEAQLISADASCYQVADGAIQVIPTGGTAPYNYHWNDGATTKNRTQLSAGNYSVTVSDVHQCSAVYQAAVAQPAAMQITAAATNPSCAAAADGSIQVAVSGGVQPLSMAWSHGASASSLQQLSGGAYTLTVTDAHQCMAVKTITLTTPAALSITAHKTDVTCAGADNGSIAVKTDGGSGAYQYNWSNGGALPNVSQLPAGYYTLTVTDGNNCSSSQNFTIDQPIALSAQALSEAPLCFGNHTGSVHLDVYGGTAPYAFIWNNNATTQNLSGLAGGNYQATVTDALGCSVSVQTVLQEPTPIVITETHTPIKCGNQPTASIHLTVSGGQPSYMFLWNNGETTSSINNLAAGNYTATVTDANGCVVSGSPITITPASPITIAKNVVNASCNGVNDGAIRLIVNGGSTPYQFRWSNGSQEQNLSLLAKGDYTVSVKDAWGCTENDSARVGTAYNIVLAAQVMQPTCAIPDGTIGVEILSGEAPFTYNWSNGATSRRITNLEPGTYNVQIADANNCWIDTSFVVLESEPFLISASGHTTVALGESAALSVSSNGSSEVSYNWLSPDIDCPACENVSVAPVRTTTYTVVATDTNGCVAQDTVSVAVQTENNLFLPNAFTPNNNDGNNDVLQLYGNLNSIHYFQLLVFNRWGEKVFETNDQYFRWDGTYKGVKQEPNTYIYVMKIVRIDGTTDKVFKGTLTIL